MHGAGVVANGIFCAARQLGNLPEAGLITQIGDPIIDSGDLRERIFFRLRTDENGRIAIIAEFFCQLGVSLSRPAFFRTMGRPAGHEQYEFCIGRNGQGRNITPQPVNIGRWHAIYSGNGQLLFLPFDCVQSGALRRIMRV